MYAYIEPRDFKAYLAENQSVETEESRSSFLRDIGTTGILFDRVNVGYVEVSPGSCVRFRSVRTVESSEVSPNPPNPPKSEIISVNLHSQSFWCGRSSRKWLCCC